MLNIGVIGAGKMGQIHADLIKNNKKLRLVALCKKRKKMIDILKQKYKVEVYTDLEEFLKIKEMDYVVISTTNESHENLTKRSMKMGKNVIVEKPMSLDHKSTLKMINASKKYRKKLFVYHNRRWDKDFLIVRQYIDSGILGNILSIQSRVLMCSPDWPSWGIDGMKNPWRVKSGGGGILLDWGPHLIDQMLVIMGKNPSQIYGFLQNGFWSKEVEDYFFTTLKFSNSLICHIEVGNNSLIPLPRWYLIGSKGTLKVKGNSVPIWDEVEVKFKNKSGVFEIQKIRLEGIGELSGEFYENLLLHLEGKNKDFVSMYEASNVINVIDAIKKSSETNKIIDF